MRRPDALAAGAAALFGLAFTAAAIAHASDPRHGSEGHTAHRGGATACNHGAQDNRLHRGPNQRPDAAQQSPQPNRDRP